MLQALASSSQRRNLLQELFADIALEVDDRAKGNFSFWIWFYLYIYWFNSTKIQSQMKNEYNDSNGNFCFKRMVYLVCMLMVFSSFLRDDNYFA